MWKMLLRCMEAESQTHIMDLPRGRAFRALRVKYVHKLVSPFLVPKTRHNRPGRGQSWDVFSRNERSHVKLEIQLNVEVQKGKGT